MPSVADKHAELMVDKSGKVRACLIKSLSDFVVSNANSSLPPLFTTDQVYVSSLVPNAPVKLGETDVVSNKTPISNLEIMSIGTCSFRFEYINSSPLQESNAPITTPGKVGAKNLFAAE